MKKLRWLLWAAFFLLPPMYFVHLGARAWFDHREGETIARLVEWQERACARLRHREKTEEYLAFLIRTRMGRVRERPDAPAALDAGLRLIGKHLPLRLSWVITDALGTIHRAHSAKGASQAAIRHLLRFCLEGRNRPTADGDTTPTGDHLIRAYVGSAIPLEELPQRPRQLIRVNSGAPRHWFYWQAIGPLGLFLHLDDHPDWADLAVRLRLSRYREQTGGSPLAMGIWRAGLARPSGDVGRALAEFQRTGQSSQIVQGSLIQVQGLDSTSLLWLAVPLEPHARQGLGVFWIDVLLAIAGLVVILGWLPRGDPGPQDREVSIRWRLALLFLYAAALPLLFMFRWAWDHLEQRRQDMVREAREQMGGRLRAIDARVPRWREQTERRLAATLRRLDLSRSPDRTRLDRFLHGLFERCFATSFQVFDRTGRLVLGQGPRHRGAAEQVAVSLIAHLNGTDPDVRNMARQAILESVGGTNLIALLAGNLGRIGEVTLGGTQGWHFWWPFRAPDGRVTHLLSASWERFRIEGRFLEREVARLRQGREGWHLMAGSSRRQQFYPGNPRLWAHLNPWLGSLSDGRATVHTRIRSPRGSFLVTGIQPREIKEFALFGLTSEVPIEQAIGRLHRHLVLTAIFLLTVSLLLGRMLSDRFLLPIGDLTGGIAAVGNQTLRHRIRVRTRDELGEVADLFNRMLENLEEISVGREVQQRLFPHDLLRVGEYVVHGRSRTASRLGGDYYEYQAIGSRCLFVLCGDVTGHGIPAALAMSTCKALVIDRALRQAEPEEFIVTLNQGLRACFRRKLLLSATILWFDVEAHTIRFFNCGHPFPCRQDVQGRVTFVEGSGFPLGSFRQVSLKPTEFGLLPGERLVCYTDGLVESLPTGLERDQFQIWRRFLAGRPRLPVAEACDDILDHHPVSGEATTLPDDFSVVVIARDPDPPGPVLHNGDSPGSDLA
ncbi:MAG: SpoIIE family protein phosphatase [Candidatus Riflebacteria bacterium]|nr:SpoIIE family protein phosphatase [Candidatus Riflebacteria bacterium]